MSAKGKMLLLLGSVALILVIPVSARLKHAEDPAAASGCQTDEL